ncbi:MAG TPA: GGDEF domain-containing protein [Vicinamibacterales bacterium]|nr:GGDEF domain-containing protein [Vicinamibacterales bacterium]
MTDPTATILAQAALLDGVPERARQALLRRGVRQQVEAGTRLLTAGRANDQLLMLLDGALDVHLPGGDGPHVKLYPGECAGELSLIDGQPASADVVASTDVTVLVIPHRHVWAAIDASAELARNLLRVLAGRVRNDDVALRQMADRRRHFERLSIIDGLTGLHNRRWLDAVFPAHLVRLQHEQRPAALLMADADQFKVLNDAYGHAVGDAVLQRVAGALVRALRPDDLLARYGGEEFAALIADVDLTEATEVAERLRAAVTSSHAAGDPDCTISVGVAQAVTGESFESLARRADAALLRAKRDGRDRVRG